MNKGQILLLIGANIRKARIEANMTQEGLAELVDIHWKTLGYIETGKRDFRASILAKIVLALKIPLSRVLDGIALNNESGPLIAKATARKRAAK